MNEPNDLTPATSSWSHSCQGLIGRVAAQYPDKTALRFNDQTFTYRELNGKANQLAGLLIDQHLPSGATIAVIIDRSPGMLVALLAIMRSGAAYLPIDPDYPRDLIGFMVSDAAAALVLTNRSFRHLPPDGPPALYIEDCLDRLAIYSEEDPGVRSDPSGLVYTLYTSGSTGRPKGVQIEHHSLLNFLLSMQQLLGITPLDRLLAVTTICFDISGLELYLPLIAGAELVLTDTIVSRDARLLLHIIRSQQISMMQATPATWKLMIEAGWDERLPLKVLCGGEAMTRPLADKLIAQSERVWNLYGPTETTIWSTIKEMRAADTVISIGWPIANTQVYILDDKMRPVPEGRPGELYIGGEGVARGYCNRPDLTRERFVDNSFSAIPGARMYRTGDTGMWLPAGQIQLFGRIDLQIKVRGYRIEPGEIEAVLLQHPQIKEAVVKGKEDQLIAYIIPRTAAGEDLTHTIRAFLRSQAPPYMIPDHWIFMQQFPLTSNGKIDRKALPDPSTEGLQGIGFVAPMTATQKLVAQTWTVHLRQQRIGINDNYFDLGGNSVAALRIMTAIESATGKRLPLSTLYKAPTVGQLSALLDGDMGAVHWESLVQIKTGTATAALYIVQGYGMNVLGFNNIARHLDPSQPVYGFQPKGLNGIDPPHDSIAAMAADYNDAILRHDPSGPYCLAGYSYGGVVAFEMARQLQASGKKVAMIAVIDTYANNWQNTDGWKSDVLKKMYRQWPKFRFVLRNLQKYPKQTLQYQRDYVTRKARSFIDQFQGRRKGPAHIVTPEERIDDLYGKAYQQYQMVPYDGAIDLFRVKVRLYFLDDMEYMGWRTLGLRGVAIHEVAGDHKTFLMPPNDKIFAEILQKTIDERSSQAREDLL